MKAKRWQMLDKYISSGFVEREIISFYDDKWHSLLATNASESSRGAELFCLQLRLSSFMKIIRKSYEFEEFCTKSFINFLSLKHAKLN